MDESSETELWRLTGHIDLDEGPIAYDQRMARAAGGAFLVHAGGGVLRADPATLTVTVRPSYEALERQLVTTFGLPLLLHGAPALLLHACAAIAPDDDGAHVFCATSGTGKSTLLAGLIKAGWPAVAEDICVIDLRTETPVVWPGPSWLRLRGPGPDGATARFRAKDKTAWDIEPWQVDQPVPVARIVFLDEPSGAEVQSANVTSHRAVAGLAAAALWLADPRDRAAATFARVVRLAKTVPALRLRLPYSGEAAAAAAAALSARPQ